MQTETESYDVVIVGAGVGGQSCAKTLSGSKFSVLLIDSKADFENKVCAGGISASDTAYIPDKYFNMPFQKISLSYGDKKFTSSYPVVTTIDRSRFLKEHLESLAMASNITIRIPSAFVDLNDNNTLTLSDSKIIRFRYLVGADGPVSSVRKSLGIPQKQTGIGMQYTIDRKLPFELILDKDIAGYFWIFPHKDYSLVGVGGRVDTVNSAIQRRNLDEFLKEHFLEPVKDSFEASVINTDYRGYSFGNRYLIGDAAGMTPLLSGKGIYPAMLSGDLVACEILGDERRHALKRRLNKKLLKKKVQDIFCDLQQTEITRRAFFHMAVRLVSIPWFERTVIKTGK